MGYWTGVLVGALNDVGPKLDNLTSSELDTLSGAVLVLATRFSTLMDDPLLPKLLRDFRDALVIEKAGRARIADTFRGEARVS